MEPDHHRDQVRRRKQRLIALLFILALAFVVRGLTMRFIHDRLSDPGWFQTGSYAVFDRQAQKILDGEASLFWIDDPSQTEAAVYPPGYPLWLALAYKISGDRSAFSVQRIQWILDSLSVLLIVAIGAVAYSWAVGVTAGFLAALFPLLALAGATPNADAPTSWFVLAGVLMLTLAVKRQKMAWAIGAGMAVGASCWLRPNAMLLVFFWAAALMLFVKVAWKPRLMFAGAAVLGLLLIVAPVIIRNTIAFKAFVPTGLGTGTNLWEGIGETDRAAEFGAVYGDQNLMEQERKEMGVAAGAPFSLYFPDGVQRDRARTRKSLSVIAHHPIWYAGVMGRRMGGMLKYAGDPPRLMGSAGINVTSNKTLPRRWRQTPLAFGVNAIGMIQSVVRWILLPLMVIGLIMAFRRDVAVTGILFSTVLYYLLASSFLHAELRYALPMHALLTVWAAFAVVFVAAKVRQLGSGSR
jgi:4-amino-4-deoxy-L-arabinose transferase-like glycosyltransferase